MAKETRYFQSTIKRAVPTDGSATGSRTVEGYAAVFNSMSKKLGWFTEEIAPDAFRECDMSDVVALFNHNPDLVLARTPKTLTLGVDERGLKYSFEAPETTVGNDLLISLDREDIRTSSFAFDVEAEEWTWGENGQPDHRKITKISKLYDVSPVTYEAYPDTDCAKRSADSARKQIADKTGIVERQQAENQLMLLKLKVY